MSRRRASAWTALRAAPSVLGRTAAKLSLGISGLGSPVPRRTQERTRAQVPAQIVRYDLAVDCVIRDRSETGARLRVLDADKVPAEFELLDKQTGETRPAHVRWRRGNEVGVSFTPERRIFGTRVRPPAARS